MLDTIRSKRTSRNLKTEISSFEKQMVTHSAWKGDISLSEAAELLEGQKPFTFVLSNGFDRQHYILSFVSDRQVVKHKNIRIVVYQGQTCFINGGSGGPCAFVDDLIQGCLKVSSKFCQPLES
ncbi:MAG: hypothetical protein KDK64_01375 [Chlamydiia bacterium]|nr:hypothetical protein [Chlamydiia bacterium]